ncbi:MAG TPA: dTDP-4-dehydrorhamnose reductase, partial [Polyangiaceae bacterium]|nr:dTDP-4-dehydrorhamnose reductase [Polyangiaceae bacterium]
MTLWLVGASGMLGRAFAEGLARTGIRVVQTNSEVDITDRQTVRTLALAERPTHIINCAGYTRVDDAETHAAEAERINVLGPENLALAATETESCLVHISSDYVFAGDAREPYDEAAPCMPRSVYGRTKWGGERRVLALHSRGRAYVVRTSWLFGKHGNNFVRTILRLLATEDELRVVSDQVGRPTYAPDLAAAVLRLIGLEPRARAPAEPGVYHYANHGATSWHEFACAIWQVALRRQFPVRTRTVTAVATS